MTITKVLDNLYKLEPETNLFLKNIETGDIYEGAIYLPKEEYKDNYIEVDEETKRETEKNKSE